MAPGFRLQQAICLVVLFLSAQARALSVDEAVGRAGTFDWGGFVTRTQPRSVRSVGIYVGGGQGYSFNSDTLVFRPASLEKLFTAATYANDRGWNPRLVPMLKESLNGVADREIAPAIGNGKLQAGLDRIESYVNQLIEAGRARHGLRAGPLAMTDELTGQQYVIDPFQIQCDSGSGLDGKLDGGPRSFADRSHVTVIGLRLFLEEVVRESFFPTFVQALPIAGIDGTLKARLTKGRARGAIAAKTGTLDDMANLAGYVHIMDGQDSRWVPFVILTEATDVKQARNFVDAIADQLATLVEAVPITSAAQDAPVRPVSSARRSSARSRLK